MVLQLPFVALVLGFWLLPAFQIRYLRWLWLLLIGATVVAALGATINYLLHCKEINEMYLHSKVMPTEPDHIRLSLIITMAIAAGVLLLSHGATAPKWRVVVIVSSVLLAAFLHLLVVRRGQMTFHALEGLAIVWVVLKKKLWKQAAAFKVVLLLIPAISYFAFQAFSNKMVKTRMDVSTVQEKIAKEGMLYSIAARVHS